jgi:hypothetical protein
VQLIEQSGEAGIGKSRLTTALLERIAGTQNDDKYRSNRLRLPVLFTDRTSIKRHLIAAAAFWRQVRHDCVLVAWLESSQPHHAVLGNRRFRQCARKTRNFRACVARRGHSGLGSRVADPRENHAGAWCRTNCGRDKNDARPVDETWGRGEIAPFGMKLSTHFYCPGRAGCMHSTGQS